MRRHPGSRALDIEISRTALFWIAFVLTRPLGATVGDLLDKPVKDGGMALNRLYASALLLAFIVGCILLTKQRAGHQLGINKSRIGTTDLRG